MGSVTPTGSRDLINCTQDSQPRPPQAKFSTDIALASCWPILRFSRFGLLQHAGMLSVPPHLARALGLQPPLPPSKIYQSHDFLDTIFLFFFGGQKPTVVGYPKTMCSCGRGDGSPPPHASAPSVMDLSLLSFVFLPTDTCQRVFRLPVSLSLTLGSGDDGWKRCHAV